jgi:hypothetical protein
MNLKAQQQADFDAGSSDEADEIISQGVSLMVSLLATDL